MGDLVKIPLSEITATCEVLDTYGITPDKLHWLRSDTGFTRRRAWNLLQSPEEDYRITVPNTPLPDLAEELDYVLNDQGAIQRVAEDEDGLTMPSRRLALLNFGKGVKTEDVFSAITTRLARRAKVGEEGWGLPASLRDLLLLQQQHSRDVIRYDIHLAYRAWDDQILTYSLRTLADASQRFLNMEDDPMQRWHQNVRFLVRKA